LGKEPRKGFPEKGKSVNTGSSGFHRLKNRARMTLGGKRVNQRGAFSKGGKKKEKGLTTTSQWERKLINLKRSLQKLY